MEKDDSGSIFDKATDWSKKKRLLKKKKVKPPSSSSLQSANPRSHSKGSLDSEFTEMFDKMKRMREDLEAQMLDLYAKVGVSRAIAEEFFGDPKNVPEMKKSEIDNEINKLEGQLDKILGPRAQKITKEFKAAKEGDKRKNKMVGQRRKWMQM